MKLSSLSAIKISLAFILFLGFCFIYPVFRPEIYLYSSFTDDFFYYLQIATNYKDGLGMTYTPGIPTNGYQPFHQYFVVVLVYLNAVFGFNILVFTKLILALIFVGSSCWLLNKLRPAAYTANIVFMLALLSYFFISYSGMESLFIVPAITILCVKMSRQQVSIYELAFWLVLTFFIRIDSIIITFPLAAYYVFLTPAFRPKLWSKVGVLAVLFLIPVGLYLFINYQIYQSYFPVSGLAKSVKSISGIHAATFQSFLFYKPYNLFNLSITVIALLILVSRRLRSINYLIILLLSVCLFYLQHAIRSDWGLWGWYFYPVSVLGFFAAYELSHIQSGDSLLSVKRLPITTSAAIGVFALAGSIVLLFLYSFPLTFINKEKKGKVDILHVAAFKIREFESAHPGRYAMGDRAGVVGYLMDSPLVQLEGLVMDKHYLEYLSKEKNLTPLLKKYQVDYYISSNARRLNDSSFIVNEPAKSAGFSNKITDTITYEVVHEFVLSGQGLLLNSTNEVIKTTIFKVPD